MSCKVICLTPTGRPASDGARVFELPGFTHYCVHKKNVQKVKHMLEKSLEARKAANENEDSLAIADIEGEINGMKYTLQTLGIRLK